MRSLHDGYLRLTPTNIMVTHYHWLGIYFSFVSMLYRRFSLRWYSLKQSFKKIKIMYCLNMKAVTYNYLFQLRATTASFWIEIFRFIFKYCTEDDG